MYREMHVYIVAIIKGIIHPKKNIQSLITNPHVISDETQELSGPDRQ